LKAASAGYGKQYFGPGPAAAKKDTEPAGWLAPLAGGIGALVLAGAVVLWRGGRPGRN
ncbi:type VII secretion-associated serine protease mycosin, partial [Streptomyces lunaelactis]|nr:type VII secretion-associated serine protease mycosin [Streptomyces lunaelactis]